jgi:hypothetical protein
VPERWFSCVSGTALAPLEDAWVAHSGATHRSHVLNDECAAILSALVHSEPATNGEICTRLAQQFDQNQVVILELVAPLWDRLIELGLLTEHPCPPRP